MFFQVTALPSALMGPLGVDTAWVWLTYPLVTQMAIHWFLLFMYVFYWVCSSLERQWGSQKFGRVFVVVTLLTACAYWAGHAALQQTPNPSVSIGGLVLPELTMFVIWGALNAEASVLLFFVLPIKAKYMAWASVALSYFQIGPILGLFVISVPLASWFWAKGTGAGLPSAPGKSIGQRLQERKREQRKSRFKMLEGQGRSEQSKDVPDLRKFQKEAEAKQKSAEGAELDRILDKIRFEGMSALSPEEKETLDKQSRKLKGEL